MKCYNCKKEISPTSRFCFFCGKEVLNRGKEVLNKIHPNIVYNDKMVHDVILIGYNAESFIDNFVTNKKDLSNDDLNNIKKDFERVKKENNL